MTLGQLQRVETLYHAAVSRPVSEREAFLADACGGDDALRLEIASLLEFAPAAEHFLDEPALRAHLTLAAKALEQGPSKDVGVTQAEGVDPPSTAIDRWGELLLLENIGGGGFGKVYRAWDTALACEVALKVIKLGGRASADEVLREGQMIARIRHRNVVIVHSAKQIGTEIGFTMELIKGRDLDDLVSHAGPMGAEEATVVGIAVCQALAAVHAANLLHRDVKARNVMRESGGRIVLTDFGAGRETTSALDGAPSDVTGTPHYMAPELFDGEAASRASDLYSVGVLLFFLTTGSYPVDGSSVTEIVSKQRRQTRRLLSDLRPDLPTPFVRAVERALSARPDQRCQTAGAMLAELSDAMPGLAHRIDARTGGSDGDGQGQGVRAPAAGRQLAAFIRVALWVAAGIPAVGLLGFLTSAQYDRMLGRVGDFADTTMGESLYWGFKAIQSPVLYVVILWAVISGSLALWSLIQHIAPPVRRSTHRMRASASLALDRFGARDTALAAQGLVVLQALSVAVVIYGFRELFVALGSTVDDNDPAIFSVLHPDSHARLAFRFVVTAMLLAMAVAWYRLLARPSAASSIPRATLGAGVAFIVLFLVAITLPYRIMRIEVPLVVYDDQACFETGKATNNKLIYCPARNPPHNRIVPVGDPKLLAGDESRLLTIFSLPSSAR